MDGPIEGIGPPTYGSAVVLSQTGPGQLSNFSFLEALLLRKTVGHEWTGAHFEFNLQENGLVEVLAGYKMINHHKDPYSVEKFTPTLRGLFSMKQIQDILEAHLTPINH